jgi:hypothetical protein
MGAIVKTEHVISAWTVDFVDSLTFLLDTVLTPDMINMIAKVAGAEIPATEEEAADADILGQILYNVANLKDPEIVVENILVAILSGDFHISYVPMNGKEIELDHYEFADAQTEAQAGNVAAQLDSIIEQSIESMRREADAHQIKLDADLRCHIEVGCDDVKMERAIANLIKNAIEALGNGGHIAVSSYADDHYAYIRIEDDGPGIPEAIRDKLFESFVTYGKKGGTGLGLAIVKSTVDMHHGKITCQAVSPRGTAFVIALPR